MRIIAAFSLFTCMSSVALAHGMSEADRIRAEEGGFFDFFPLGAVHMLTGYDHLLFLFGVVFFLTKFKDILKFVTAFTLGHSITLIGATFLGIQANYFLVDAVIALTVCYKGFDNVDGFKKYLGMKPPNMLMAVFIFGLIHGFGLSTRLQQLTIGEGLDLLGKIISFNIGVEAGQVAALIVILSLLSAWRHTESFARFSMASNVGLIIVGGLLFTMQMHGYTHGAHPDSFGFPSDAHSHAHGEMYREREMSVTPSSAGGLEGALDTLDGQPGSAEGGDTTPADIAPESEPDNPQKPWVRPSNPN
ncbi:MAG: HupE/UreJ family protein [Candidatus Hydrogenedentes bacterium]|nr:HupE/UreJ family protein [Candidatus Hydrogenedentota bacterium]